MDKIKEILVYKFWILLGVALIAPVVGWWLGSNEVNTNIEARKSRIESAYNNIPKAGDELINNVWIEGANARNGEQEVAIDEAWQALATRQEDLKTWPPLLAADVAEIGLTAPIPADKRTLYPREYLLEWDKLYYIIDPLRDVDTFDEKTGEHLERDREGIVQLAPTSLPPAWQAWGNFQPTSEEMRNAQEDMWLYRSLLQAIRNVNQDATSANDAAVLVINDLQVLSGLAKKGTAGRSARRGGGSNLDADERDGDSGGDSNRARGAGSSKALSFLQTGYEGFFDFVGGGPNAARQAAKKVDDFTDERDEVGNNSRGAVDPRKFRYYEETDQYKMRVFNMELIIDHRRLPDLLAELSNSPWPINIIRVQEKNMQPIGSGVSGVGRRGGRRSVGGGAGSHSGGGSSVGGGFGVEGANIQSSPASHSRSALENRAYLVNVGISGTMRMFKTQAEVAAGTETASATPEPQKVRPSPPSEMAEKFPMYFDLFGAGATRSGPGRGFSGGDHEDT